MQVLKSEKVVEQAEVLCETTYWTTIMHRVLDGVAILSGTTSDKAVEIVEKEHVFMIALSSSDQQINSALS